jgi:SAM-dependent methyltransferase
MSRENGALRILKYNWPVFAATWVASLLVFLWASITGHAWLAAIAPGPALWSLLSLLVSYYIYDRSGLTEGAWIHALLGGHVDAWVNVHAGLDAEVLLDSALSTACVAHVDIFDSATMDAPSIARARGVTAQQHVSRSGTPASLPLEEEVCDTLFVLFTAHEIRSQSAREAFFAESRRVLRPNGRMLLLEHVQDFANFAAFGPGMFHFQTRREWLRLADHAKFLMVREARITPWVMALVLEKRA